MVWIEDRDWTNDLEYKWQVAAYVERKGVSAEAAAPHLIAARWELEIEDRQLDHFHFVSNEGALSVPEWMAIGRKVWGLAFTTRRMLPHPFCSSFIVPDEADTCRRSDGERRA